MALPVSPVAGVGWGEWLVEGRGAGDPARRRGKSAPPAALLPAQPPSVHSRGQETVNRRALASEGWWWWWVCGPVGSRVL